MRLASLVIVASLLATASAHAEPKDLLPLERGTYVREGFDAGDPPLAAIVEYDGATFSGAHSGACTSRLLGHDGATYRLSTTCSAEGDGTPAEPYTEQQRIVVRSSTRMEFTHGDDSAVYRLVDAS